MPARRMSERKAYPLRLGVDVMTAMQRWADDDLRSLNAQIEFVLREALRGNGRLGKGSKRPNPTDTATSKDE